jgi:chaperonin cofactor prefoldin
VSVTVSVNVAPGELIDKITILEIKLERIEDETKLANVRLEYDTLNAARDEAIPKSEELDQLSAELKKINEALWEIEDDIRDCERAKDFGDGFIKLARAVYVTNDKRMAVKRQINDLLGSALVEEKSYAAY